MSTYTRPDSPFWWICLEIPESRPLRESTRIPVDGGTPEQTKANALLAKQVYSVKMGDLARRRHQFAPDRQVITFAAFRAWYYDHVSSAKRNPFNERSMLNLLGPYFDPALLHTIRHKDVVEWRTERAKDVAEATVNRELGLLRHVFTSAIRQGYVETNPCTGVKMLRIPEQEIRLLEPDEERRLLAACTPEEHAIIVCALDTLQRASNVAGLKRAQDHGTYITVLNPKVKGYKVPVSERLRTALDALPAAGPHYFPSVQPRGRGNATKERLKRLGQMLARLLEAAEIPHRRKEGGITFHNLRHTGASRMLARGVDIKTVQQLGGWQNLDVLQRYLHPTDSQKRAAVEAVSREPDVNASVPPSPP